MKALLLTKYLYMDIWQAVPTNQECAFPQEKI